MRILTAMAGAPVGGAETFFISLSLALKHAGVEVKTALRASALREQMLRAGGVEYVTAPFGQHFDFSTKKNVLRLARRFRPDAALSFAERASAKMPRLDCPLVGRLGGYYKLKYFTHCDHLVCITPDIKRHVMENGWPETRATYIPNFPSVTDELALDRETLATPKDAKLALALGRLHKNKALDVLLAAVAQLPGLYLWIAGEGPEREALVKLAGELGISNRVRFLGWRTDRTALLRAADVCVFPSRWEPNGTVVVEAWAHGVPLVSTASAGPSWIARHAEDALLTPIDDAQALAAAIAKVLSSPDLARTLMANGLKRVAAEFSEAYVVARYIEMFEKVRNEARQ